MPVIRRRVICYQMALLLFDKKIHVKTERSCKNGRAVLQVKQGDGSLFYIQSDFSHSLLYVCISMA